MSNGIAWARGSSVTDIDDTSMGFRLLRLHGYDMSAGECQWFNFLSVRIWIIHLYMHVVKRYFYTVVCFTRAIVTPSKFPIDHFNCPEMSSPRGSWFFCGSHLQLVNVRLWDCADVFRPFCNDQNEFFTYFGSVGELGPTCLFNVYRLSQTGFPGENILEAAETFAKDRLEEMLEKNDIFDKWVISKDLAGEVRPLHIFIRV